MEQGKLRRQLSLVDLTFLGLGAIIGSGWLLGALGGATLAGPSAWIAWVIGAIAVMLIGLVYAELGGAMPRAGGIIRYPDYSHGPLVGYLMGFAALIAYSSVAGIEAEAMRQYAQHWWPALGWQTASGSGPTLLGWFVQAALLTIFFLINYWSVNVFGKINSVWTFFKFVVPLLTVIVFFGHFHASNFTSHGFAPNGAAGIETAVATGGIIFSYLGFRQAIDFAGEARNPQRNVPISIVLAIAIAAVLYILLQIVFIGAVPSSALAGGWSKLNYTAPFAQLATALGIGWMGVILYGDAVISPSGTGNIYLSSTARVIYAWARTKTFFPLFARVSPKTGIPRPALWLSYILAIMWTLPFPTWSKLVGVVSSATVLTYIIGPISAAALRRTAKNLNRPFRLPGMGLIAPLAFIVATLIIYWSGFSIDAWLIGLQIVLWGIYVIALRAVVPTDTVPFAQQVKSSLWLVCFYAVLWIMSYLGDKSFGGRGLIPAPWDQIIVVVLAVGAYAWGVASALPYANYEEHEEAEEAAATVAHL
ncbi:APC family permease [Alicyclobacillus sendaiensis]|uniref:APC family permease n=1 Tax=Alicyclobacillus sendaiensis PA2 TaxID=3029425 RepID=A0ABT6XZY6_ALISE|nr:APC family permease [Alicyclobacillus sendaiensis]MDI9260646.1 APC family permease [Alicyclobacillus sendaiensis PA2]